MFLGVGDRGPDAFYRVLLVQGAYGAPVDALAAHCAGYIAQLGVVGRCDDCPEATVDRAYGSHRLQIVADVDAAPAQDALVRIPHERVGAGVYRVIRLLSLEPDTGNVVLVRQRTKLAILVANAGRTLEWMV